VLDLEPGEWEVSAAPIPRQEDPPGQRFPTTSGRGTTAFTPAVRARAPGARLAVWPAMVLLGTVLALLTQAALAVGRGVPVLPLLAVTVLACLLGVVGAKIYYLVTHRGEPTNLLTVGMSLQGFVLAAVSALTIGSLATGLPGWLALDLTAPGLMFGVTVGRFGCFFGGCCAGRPTASRWGRWSSNRRLGLRRIPVQLMESAAAGFLGSVALLLLTWGDPPTSGVVFVGTIAAYTLVRQLLFPLRELPRKTAHGRALMTVASVAVLLADLAAAVTT
jgi:phosphatidylglycerol---prolipoprotein diacylglyceryl transferase